jgi:cyclopropane-fatty-acyl-phospholipid synthase
VPALLTAIMDIDTDYPRTLREWGRRLENNLSQDMLAKECPRLNDRSEFDMFTRKWQYLFAYAAAGFAKGYITCHMLTFIRGVRTYIFPCHGPLLCAYQPETE